MELKGFQAWVLVDGQAVNQYGVETELEANKTTCWIPSEAGKASRLSRSRSVHRCLLTTITQKFTVKWKDSTRHRDTVTAGYVYLDGIKCGGRFIWKSAYTHVNTAERSSAATSMTTERPYVFSPIEFTGIFVSSIRGNQSKLMSI